MRRLIRTFSVIALIGVCHLAAAAGFDAAKIADVKKAGAAFLALGKDAYKTGQPPRQSDPAAGKLLDTIFNTDVLNGPPPVTFAQFLDVNDWLAQVVGVGLIYVTSGTGIADLSAVTGLTAKQQEQMNANVILFAPEVGRYYDAQLSVSRVEIDLVVGELAAHPDNYKSGTKAQGVAQMRSGLAMTLRGVVTTFQITGVDPAWLRGRLPALLALAPTAAKFLDADQKRQIRDLATTIAIGASDAGVKSGLNSFARTIAP